jgi:hypothetical protein
MTFSVHVTGRRLSDGQNYQMQLHLDANQESDVLEYLDQAYDWSDAALRDVHIQAVAA